MKNGLMRLSVAPSRALRETGSVKTANGSWFLRFQEERQLRQQNAALILFRYLTNARIFSSHSGHPVFSVMYISSAMTATKKNAVLRITPANLRKRGKNMPVKFAQTVVRHLPLNPCRCPPPSHPQG